MFASKLLELIDEGYEIRFIPCDKDGNFRVSLVKDDFRSQFALDILAGEYAFALTDEEFLLCIIERLVIDFERSKNA